MGVVYLAYDPRLERRVALKLLRTELAADAGEATVASSRLRLLREAQSLAALSHPNVVAIFDVGTNEDEDVYIAMEYVQGQPLSDWLHAGERPWRDALTRCIAAGRGLAAAHAIGMMHRDFKPDNVLLADDGRVIVLDFGLAGHEARNESDPVDSATHRTGGSRVSTDSHLTQVGDVMGTPGYMPVEQLRGLAVDARADIFAFCVTAFHAIHGVRPYEGDNLEALIRVQTRGDIRSDGLRRGVPRWLAATLARGLRPDPRDRPQNLERMLDDLESRLVASRSRYVAAGLVAGLTGLGLLQTAIADDRERDCDGAVATMRANYDDARRSTIRQSFAATQLSYAIENFASVDTRLVALREAWARDYRAVCEGHPQLSAPGDFDLGMRCLESARASFSTLVRQLEHSDRDTVMRAMPATLALPDPDRCLDSRSLRRAVELPRDPLVRADIARAELELGEINTLRSLGKYRLALDALERLWNEIRELDHPPALARVQLARGGILQSSKDPFGAAEAFRHGLQLSIAGGDSIHAADAASNLLFVEGYLLRAKDRRPELVEQARSLVRATGDAHEQLVHFTRNHAIIVAVEGHPREALAEFRKVYELHVDRHGPRSHEAAFALANVAAAHSQLLDHETSAELLEQVVAIERELYDGVHPRIASSLERLQSARKLAGQFARARELGLEAVAICERMFGWDDRACSPYLDNTIRECIDDGHLATAEALIEKLARLDGETLPRRRRPIELWRAQLALSREEFEAAQRWTARGLERLRKQANAPDYMQVIGALLTARTGGGPAKFRMEALLGTLARMQLDPKYERARRYQVVRVLRDSASSADRRLELSRETLAIGLENFGSAARNRRMAGDLRSHARALRLAGQLERALEQANIALKGARSGHGRRAPKVAEFLRERAACHRALGDLDAAIADLDLALETHDPRQSPAALRAHLEVDLARAQIERGDGDDVDRARAGLGRAREFYRTRGDDHRDGDRRVRELLKSSQPRRAD